MKELFSLVWLVIILATYLKQWWRVIQDIKKVKEQYGRKDIYKHLTRFSRFWIKLHEIIIFLWSLSYWGE